MNPTVTAKPPWWWGFAKPLLQGAERHALSGLGGVLVSLGAMKADDSTHFVEIAAGIIAWGVGYFWSNYTAHDKNNQIAVANAVAANATIVAETQRVTGTEVPL